MSRVVTEGERNLWRRGGYSCSASLFPGHDGAAALIGFSKATFFFHHLKEKRAVWSKVGQKLLSLFHTDDDFLKAAVNRKAAPLHTTLFRKPPRCSLNTVVFHFQLGVRIWSIWKSWVILWSWTWPPFVFRCWLGCWWHKIELNNFINCTKEKFT